MGLLPRSLTRTLSAKTIATLSGDMLQRPKRPNLAPLRFMLPSLRKFLIGCAVFASAMVPSLASPAQAAEWYFYVENDRRSTMTRLEVKEQGGSWKRFNLNGGIRAGKKARIHWAASENDGDCKQFIRATFADGNMSSPAQYDFCNNLDAPIVFSD